jgi:glyoxylase-like metal-dependent hydrolase (beta-lactamase superfamily II)
MITIKHFVFNELAVNAFVLFDETRDCIIVDPGCNTTRQCTSLEDFINLNQLKPVCIVNTHGHFDHIFGNAWVKEVFQCPLLIHKNDLPLLVHAEKHAGIFGFSISKSPLPDRYLNSGESLSFGLSALEIIHIPGHSPGGIVLYAASEGFIICGDVLFRGSIGRTDLPGGDYDLLIHGIREKLMILPRETLVWPGHGPSTTIGHEYDTNPFLS